MIFDSLTDRYLEPETVHRREMKLNEAGARKNCRRIKELQRTRSLAEEENDVGGKRRRGEINRNVGKSEIDRVPENDVGSSLHGKVSIIGRRREMEDAVAVELGFLGRGKRGRSYDFFRGLRRSWGLAQACSEMLHKLLVVILGEENNEEWEIDWARLMDEGFRRMDEEVNKDGAEVAAMGSTAVVGEDVVVVANCGDSRAVLSRGGAAIPLSDDHKPDRPDELERIEVSGGKVINWNGQRVLGVLATSRSIGDNYLKPFVITEPEVKVITRSDADEFLILASDGLWDVVSNDLACQVARRCLDWPKRRNYQVSRAAQTINASRAAAVLAELAMARGSGDNISVIVVKLKQTGGAGQTSLSPSGNISSNGVIQEQC